MYNITFIIPCGRIPFKIAGQLTVDSILAVHPNSEIIVTSKEKIDYKNIIYIKENESNFGAVEPINTMARAATSDFVCLLNDDFYIKDNLEPIIDEIIKDDLIGLTLMPKDWAYTGPGNIPSEVRNISLDIANMPFPIVRKNFIAKHGGLLYSRFAHHYADCALAFLLRRVYKQDKLVFDNKQIYAHDLKHNTSLDYYTKKSKEDYRTYQQIVFYTDIYSMMDSLKTEDYLKFHEI